MAVKIRLQRHGKKGKPFYWIVAADARAKRDGRYLEKLGTYDPNTNPAQIDLNIDGAVKWLNNGAQPTDTAKAILSYKGVLLKKHLQGGVKKGAFTQEQAEAKYQAWLQEKEAKIEGKSNKLAEEAQKAKAKALAAEKEVLEKRRAAAQATAEDTSKEVVEEIAAETEVEATSAEATEAETTDTSKDQTAE